MRESALKKEFPKENFSAPFTNLISNSPALLVELTSKLKGNAPPCVLISALQIPETGV